MPASTHFTNWQKPQSGETNTEPRIRHLTDYMYLHRKETCMVDLVCSAAGLTAVAVNLIAITAVLALSLLQRLKLGAVLGAWTGLASGLGAAGLL
jgi:hypothetical protein